MHACMHSVFVVFVAMLDPCCDRPPSMLQTPSPTPSRALGESGAVLMYWMCGYAAAVAGMSDCGWPGLNSYFTFCTPPGQGSTPYHDGGPIVIIIPFLRMVLQSDVPLNSFHFRVLVTIARDGENVGIHFPKSNTSLYFTISVSGPYFLQPV